MLRGTSGEPEMVLRGPSGEPETPSVFWFGSTGSHFRCAFPAGSSARPDLDQLRRQARDLLAAATRDVPDALARIRAVSDRIILAPAQLAGARSYGFPSWAGLKSEVIRREILDERDVTRLAAGPGRGSRARHRPDGALVRPPAGRGTLERRDHAAVRHQPPDLARRHRHGSDGPGPAGRGAPVNGHPDEPEMLDEAGRTPVQLSGIGQLGFPGKPDPAQVEPF